MHDKFGGNYLPGVLTSLSVRPSALRPFAVRHTSFVRPPCLRPPCVRPPSLRPFYVCGDPVDNPGDAIWTLGNPYEHSRWNPWWPHGFYTEIHGDPWDPMRTLWALWGSEETCFSLPSARKFRAGLGWGNGLGI
jgi:hypothetical protein